MQVSELFAYLIKSDFLDFLSADPYSLIWMWLADLKGYLDVL
jgi:hypothetical protein